MKQAVPAATASSVQLGAQKVLLTKGPILSDRAPAESLAAPVSQKCLVLLLC